MQTPHRVSWSRALGDFYRDIRRPLDWSPNTLRAYGNLPTEVIEADLGERLLGYIVREQMMSDAVLEARIRDMSKRYEYVYTLRFQVFREPPLGIVLARKIIAHRKFRREHT